MNRYEYIDPLYGLSYMEEPYASALTNTTLFKEKQRLSSIKSLGLISQVFPGGTHAKWEHYLGMYSVVTQIELWMKKEEIEKMKWLCLVGGMGQLPFTYATSNSVLLALTLSKEFKNDFKIFVKPIKKICDNCQGNNECDEKPFDVLYKEAGIGSLRGILSGYKISTLPRNIDIGNRDGLILSCFCKNDPVYKLNRVISSYDYMQRDLYHTGIAKFSVGCREVFRSLENGLEALGNSSNLKLLEQLYSYLVNSLYLYPSVACLESSFSKALVQKLCTKELTINELLEFNDDALIKKIGDNLIQELVKRKPIFTVQRDVSADILHLNNVKFESALLGFNKKEYSKLINYPEQDGIIISTYYMGLSDDLEETFRVIVNVLDNKHKLMPFVRVITNMKDYLLQRQEITSKLAEELIYYSFGVNKVSSNYSKVRSSLLGFNNGLNKKEITEIISRTLDIVDECMNKGNLVLGIPYKLESLTKRLRKNNKGMRIIREKTFNYTWERMVLGLLDTYPGRNETRLIWGPLFNKFKKYVYENNLFESGDLVETLIFIKELISKGRGISWVLPSVTLINEQQDKKLNAEVDVISVYIFEDQVEIKLFECSKSDSKHKAAGDYQKILNIQNHLNSLGHKDLLVTPKIYGNANINQDFVSIKDVCLN